MATVEDTEAASLLTWTDRHSVLSAQITAW
jgi:hypothetical protein